MNKLAETGKTPNISLYNQYHREGNKLNTLCQYLLTYYFCTVCIYVCMGQTNFFFLPIF